MIKKSSIEKRNPGVTVIAGSIAALAIMIAFNIFPSSLNNIAQVAYFAFVAFVALLAFAVAVYGRKNALKNLIDAILDFSM